MHKSFTFASAALLAVMLCFTAVRPAAALSQEQEVVDKARITAAKLLQHIADGRQARQLLGGNRDAEGELEVGSEEAQRLRRLRLRQDVVRLGMAKITAVARGQDVSDGGAEVHAKDRKQV